MTCHWLPVSECKISRHIILGFENSMTCRWRIRTFGKYISGECFDNVANSVTIPTICSARRSVHHENKSV